MAAFSVLSGMEEYFVTILILVVLHELCHIFTAGIWGLKTTSVTLTAIGAAAEINGLEQLHITKRIAVAFAGPAFNLLLCPLCAYPVRQINLALALFNLLPVYPLDGGKILHYLISYFTGVLRGNIFTVKLSLVLSLTLIGAGMVQLALYPPNISLLCIGIYFYKLNKASRINLTYTFYKSIIYKNDNKIMPVRCMTASGKMDIKALVYRLGWDYYTLVYVREGDTLIPVSEETLLAHILQNGLRGCAGMIAKNNIQKEG
ncbi:MAG: site-2 protease family protein [Firmicutes bacterium]|nr:site-2 protease family protein [Bacillota bacterium]MBQ9604115.1 site-2 protease family protein [Bacillota bacterium]